MRVGLHGADNQLTITDGGLVQAWTIRLGYYPGSSGTLELSGILRLDGDTFNSGTLLAIGNGGPSTSAVQLLSGTVGIAASGILRLGNDIPSGNVAVINQGALQVRAGAFTNAASAYFKNTGSDVTFFNAFYNNGTYLSDPAMNTFNGSVALDATGVLAGGAGDVFVIGGDLTSANPTGLQLAGAKVIFNDGAHTFTLAGPASIGELELTSGASVSLVGGDLYVGLLNADTNQFTTAQTIYYDPAQNLSLAGQTYALDGGGTLTAVPEPSSVGLVLFGIVAVFTAAHRHRK